MNDEQIANLLRTERLAPPTQELDQRIGALFDHALSGQRQRCRIILRWTGLAAALAGAGYAAIALRLTPSPPRTQLIRLTAQGDLSRFLQADQQPPPPPPLQVRVTSPSK